MNNIFRTIPTEAQAHEIELIREQAEIELGEKVARAIKGGKWPRFGYTTAQVMSSADEYETWLKEVMKEELAEIEIVDETVE